MVPRRHDEQNGARTARSTVPIAIGAVVIALVEVLVPASKGLLTLALVATPGAILLVTTALAAHLWSRRTFLRLFRATGVTGLVGAATAVFHDHQDPILLVYAAILLLLTIAYLIGTTEALVWAAPCLVLVAAGTVYGPETPEPLGTVGGLIVHSSVVVAVLIFAVEMRRSHDRHAAQLTRLASTDALTGLDNRGQFNRNLAARILEAHRTGQAGAVAFFDLDSMKVINDSYGHDHGDRYLHDLAARLRGGIRATDGVARLGGDEFAVIFHPVSSDVEAEQLADRLRGRLSKPWRCHGHTHFPAASVGVAGFAGGDEVDDVLSRADDAMYQAKRSGGGRTERSASPGRPL